MVRALVFCILYAALNVSGAAIIKWNLKGRVLIDYSSWINFLARAQVIGAFALVFASALVMFKALSTADFSFVIPVSTGVNFMLTILVGFLIFHDKLSWWSALGFSLIVLGIIFLSLNGRGPS